jgi:hypothetical protein
MLGLFLVWVAGMLARGDYEAWPAFSATHVATLGWVTMTIMGAAAQMAPALLGARVRAERTVPWLYGLFALSVVAVVVGFAHGALQFVAAGGAGVTVASWWFLAIVVSTLRSAGPKRVILSPHIPVALTCFALVLLWGTMLAANLRRAFWPAQLIGHRGLVVHLTLGLGGWFGLMVVGTFYRLVPLVHGARVTDSRRGKVILALGVLAIVGALVGIAMGTLLMLRVAALLAAAGLGFFSWEVLHVLAHRRNRAPDLNVSHWHAVVGYSLVLACAGGGWGLGWLRTDPSDRLGEVVVVLFLLGWVTQAIIGQLYKITPFLMWYYRATIPDVLAIPRQPAPYNPLLGRFVLWLSNVGVAVLTAGIWFGADQVAQGGAVLVAAAAWILAYLLAYRWVPPAVTRALVFEWRWRIS